MFLAILLMFSCFTYNEISNTNTNKAYAQSELTPEEIYQEYTNAQNAGDLATYRKYISQSLYNKTLEIPDAENMFKMIGPMGVIKDFQIIDKNISGDTATITATGTSPTSGAASNGTIIMVNEDGMWKVKTEKWVSKDKNSTETFTVGE